jgi:hypothetical protein
VGIQRNERADVLANERSISGTLFQDQARLNTVNSSDIHTRARLLTKWQKKLNDCEMGRYCYSIVASTVDKRVFLVAMSRLTYWCHTGTRAHLQSKNVVQDAFCQCAMGYDTIDQGLLEYKKSSGLPE